VVISRQMAKVGFCLLCLGLSACTVAPVVPTRTAATPTQAASAGACPLTEALWIKPPDDAAVQNPPQYGYYFVNEDRSMWASAWWTGEEETYLRADEAGVKVGWFRPAGATLEITGQRLDAPASPLDAHVPCCYPTRFQSSGLFFPTEGCWQVNAQAAGSQLSFVVQVAP